MDNLQRDGIKLSQTSPAYLHANSTSHTWVFSAIAELIDNAYDPDVRARQLHIEIQSINNQQCLVFSDDGSGMDHDKLHKMLSFGYSEKEEIGGIKPIGKYGNGFKSGSMRIGKDALVLTRQKNMLSAGLLSQTYHEKMQLTTVFVPIVTLMNDGSQNGTLEPDAPISHNNLNEILRNSIFSTRKKLFEAIKQTPHLHKPVDSGTTIFIWNLRCDQQTMELELDMETDPVDIRTRTLEEEKKTTPEYKQSLRKYSSILYLKPKMNIFIRGVKVKQRLMTKTLSRTETDFYRPHHAQVMGRIKRIAVTFGFNPISLNPAMDDYGMVLYHNNRLIKAFEKLGYQKQPNDMGFGVIGVAEVNSLTPIQNKQDFNQDEKYRRYMLSFSKLLNEYCDERSSIKPDQVLDETLHPDSNWVKCDTCLKWRRLPPGVQALEELWYCHSHPSDQFNRCELPEEPLQEDETDVYPKPMKKLKEAQKAHRRKQHERHKAQLTEREARIQQREHRAAAQAKRLKRSHSNQLKESREKLRSQNDVIVQLRNEVMSLRSREVANSSNTPSTCEEMKNIEDIEKSPLAKKNKCMIFDSSDGCQIYNMDTQKIVKTKICDFGKDATARHAVTGPQDHQLIYKFCGNEMWSMDCLSGAITKQRAIFDGIQNCKLFSTSRTIYMPMSGPSIMEYNHKTGLIKYHILAVCQGSNVAKVLDIITPGDSFPKVVVQYENTAGAHMQQNNTDNSTWEVLPCSNLQGFVIHPHIEYLSFESKLCCNPIGVFYLGYGSDNQFESKTICKSDVSNDVLSITIKADNKPVKSFRCNEENESGVILEHGDILIRNHEKTHWWHAGKLPESFDIKAADESNCNISVAYISDSAIIPDEEAN